MTATARISPVFVLMLFAGSACGADFEVATATNQTGVELYRSVAARQQRGNLAVSPYSIESAMALAFEGAEGRTREEMARVLHLPADSSTLAASFARARAMLDSARAGAEWLAADRLFGQKGYAFRDSFLKLLDAGYGAPFETADFRRDADPSRMRINSWVSEATRGKIRDLIPDGGVNRHTRLVLVDALYMKATWRTPFEEDRTRDRPFHVEGGTAENVPTMAMTEALGYRKEPGFTAVTLPYAGGNLQFLILLPDGPDGIERLLRDLTADLLRRCAEIPTTRVSLLLPRFRMKGPTLPLGEDLRALGMKTAFDVPRGSADFDRMAPKTPDDYLALSEVFHQVFVELDEKGTEAAAATGVVVMKPLAVEAELPAIQVQVDHPFLFAIQHRGSGLCLFLGRITDPRN